jgi:hypothetical protein
MVFNMRWQLENSRHMSALTGGETAGFKYGDETFARLDGSTRAQYLLGYAPTNNEWDGRFRKVRVAVKRPGVRVLYRQGYYGRKQERPIDRRQFMTFSRITSALGYHLPIRDIRLTLDAPSLIENPHGTIVIATARIEPGAITFTREGDEYGATLDAFFGAADGKDRMVGEGWETLAFRLTPQEHDRFLREGLGFTVRIPVRAEPSRLKVVLYDYAMDVLGSATARIGK